MFNPLYTEGVTLIKGTSRNEVLQGTLLPTRTRPIPQTGVLPGPTRPIEVATTRKLGGGDGCTGPIPRTQP